MTHRNSSLKKFHYDAFISYRHTELDKFVAENLHKQLEAFRMPKSVTKNRVGRKNRIERVFRDKEELPLTSNLEDPIMQALESSEWLIVICSPRLRESAWCKKEIETFVALRGREHVLAVLVEGEPAESFPDELLFRIEKQTRPDGTVEEVKIPVEPLAADVRGKDKKEILKNMKTEVLRVLAAMFQVSYDDLRQRHRERRMRRILTASLVGGVAGLAFGAYCGATAIRISNQNKQIEAQSQEIAAQNEKLAMSQALSLAEEANRYLNEGNREAALEVAYAAMTEVDGITMPYTPEAQCALAESLGVYNIGNVFKANYQFETMGMIKSVNVSEDQTKLMIFDDTGVLTVYNLSDRSVVLQLTQDQARISAGKGYHFLADNRLAYVDSNFQVTIYNLESKEIQATLPSESVFTIHGDDSGNYFIVEGLFGTFEVYDGHTLELLGEMPEVQNMKSTDKMYFHESGIMAQVSSDSLSDTSNVVHFIDLKTQGIINSVLLADLAVTDVALNENQAFIVPHYPEGNAKYYKTQILNIDIATGETIWQTENERYMNEKLILPTSSDAEDMMLVTAETLSLIDMSSGEFGDAAYPDSEVVQVYPISSNQFYAFCQDGTWITMESDYAYPMNYSHMFECKSDYNQSIQICSEGLVVLPADDKKITIYSAGTGPDVQESTHTVAARERDRLEGDEAAELAHSYGLANPDFVKSGFYSDDEKYFFVNYWDGTLLIYDTVAGESVAVHEDFKEVYAYLGTDHNGYHYITGYNGGYVLNQNMKPIAHIRDLVDMDRDNDKVYMQSGSTVYEAPLYTAEELVDIAESVKE